MKKKTIAVTCISLLICGLFSACSMVSDSEKNRALAEEAIERGKKLLAAGDIEGAMKEFNKAKELLANEDDENYKAEKLGEIARALEEEAEKLRESDPTAASLASSNALVFASNALSLNAEDPNALFVQGMAEMTKRNYPAAERCFRKAAAKDPSNSINYYQLGRALFMQKKFAEAENAFKSSVKLDGTFSNAYYNLGVTQTKLNKTSDALSSPGTPRSSSIVAILIFSPLLVFILQYLPG